MPGKPSRPRNRDRPPALGGSPLKRPYAGRKAPAPRRLRYARAQFCFSTRSPAAGYPSASIRLCRHVQFALVTKVQIKWPPPRRLQGEPDTSGDDGPENRGVREPRRPKPNRGSGGAALPRPEPPREPEGPELPSPPPPLGQPCGSGTSTSLPLLDGCDTLTRLLLSRGGEVSTAAAPLAHTGHSALVGQLAPAIRRKGQRRPSSPRLSLCMVSSSHGAVSLAVASRGGCCTKPPEKRRSPLAEARTRAAVPTDIAADGPFARDAMAVLGAHP